MLVYLFFSDGAAWYEYPVGNPTPLQGKLVNMHTMSSPGAKKSFQMKKAKVLHNPEAGEGETSRRDLIRKIESAGFKCSYSSTKQFCWENIETEEIDFLILAGGDGTVRKIADEVLARKVIEKSLPIGLLPFGTANNIAKTLGLCENASDIIAGWHNPSRKKFDVGKISGLEKPAFFLESFGYGLFPKLMHEMKRQKKNDLEDAKEKLKAALEILRDMILTSSPQKCKLEINDRDYSGEFLLIEVMNIRSIGPNLNLAPDADPGDGQFEVVLITEKQRSALAEYVQKKIDDREVLFDFPILKARDLSIFWDGKYVHVDDEYYKLDEPVKIKIEMREGLLEFLLPG
jgi:diacylglycerol kinase family enzyme